jgi:hypothetical protein
VQVTGQTSARCACADMRFVIPSERDLAVSGA